MSKSFSVTVSGSLSVSLFDFHLFSRPLVPRSRHKDTKYFTSLSCEALLKTFVLPRTQYVKRLTNIFLLGYSFLVIGIGFAIGIAFATPLPSYKKICGNLCNPWIKKISQLGYWIFHVRYWIFFRLIQPLQKGL